MRRLLALLILFTLSPSLLADIKARLDQAQFASATNLNQTSLERKNQSVLTYLWVDVYAAAWYAEPHVSPRQALDPRISKRLELYYFRQIDRSDVVEAAWVTLRRQHNPATLERLRGELDELHGKFNDIEPGDRYALNYHASSGLSLERNGEITFASSNPELASAYLGIWLAPNGLSEELRDKLLAD